MQRLSRQRSAGGRELHDSMLEYLSRAKEALGESNGPQDLGKRLKGPFLTFDGSALLDHELRFTFKLATT